MDIELSLWMLEPATTTVAASDKANCHLQDDKLLYPSFDAFMVAIQDSGKEKNDLRRIAMRQVS